MTKPAPSLFMAVLAFLTLPGIVAFLVPLVLFRPVDRSRPFATEGIVVLFLGSLILAWCVRAFFVSGKGTLAPWAPPRHLVQVGLYRYSRNPMYIGVLLIVSGWALGFRSPALWIYALVLAVAFHLRVVLGEEPWLTRVHGTAWTSYKAIVPRWLAIFPLTHHEGAAMKDTVIRFFGRTISSDAFDMKLGQAVCYVASVVLLFVSWWKLSKLELGEAPLFFGLLLSFCPPLLLLIIGLLLPSATNAWKPHT